MKRLFYFIQNVVPNLVGLLGYPTIKIYPDVAEVYFDCVEVIRDFSALKVECDAFRMFANDSSLTCVYTFNLDSHA